MKLPRDMGGEELAALLGSIVNEIAAYLEIEREELVKELFR